MKRTGTNPAGPAPTTKKSRPLYETITPFPNPSSDSLAYKLPSSVPRPGDTGKFSPVPVPSVFRTSSRNLKENRVGSKPKSRSKSKSRSRKGVLESPFPVFDAADEIDIPTRFPKRTLSDKFQPNIPIPQQSHSTTTSPQSGLPQSERRRRPSAPTPPRTHISFLDPDIKHHAGLGDVEFSIASPEVDFNRPPSQLSFYDGADGMFADVQFVSTPFRFARTRKGNGEGTIDPRLLSKRDNPVSDTDTDEEGVITSPYKLLKRSLRKKRQMSAGYMTPDEEEEETGWISDSLISPPTRGDVEMAEPDLAEELSLDSLVLTCEARPGPVRTRSLDSSASSLAPALPIKTATRRTRSGTVLQSHSTTNEVAVGRTRSGTITQRTRSGTVTKRARSGSILASPPPPVVSGGRTRSGSILNNRVPPPPLVGRKPGRLVSTLGGDGDDEYSEDEVLCC
ncbi:uncharacterized protein EV420DRAFT_483273 [Desarmillaria tabescens]|uniref:Uncharacterized protein n=1 Tax=Armillaria tabescens TaxID=1929756 RepID=A0AA39N582_ARMTA|nr:uncharacterized protein EV420DRAFT_483273 [Desarmillaria tabescens]KAK0457864.1 hypothetical protein EV420DRAFT_483273 [Desarmillaria tabescens]